MGRVVGLIFPASNEAGKPKTKKEIQAFLDEKGIEYPSDATVAELKALIPED